MKTKSNYFHVSHARIERTYNIIFIQHLTCTFAFVDEFKAQTRERKRERKKAKNDKKIV